MNFKIWSGLAAVSLLLTPLGLALPIYANPLAALAVEPEDIVPNEEVQTPLNSPIQGSVAVPSAEDTSAEETKVGQVASTLSDVLAELEGSTALANPANSGSSAPAADRTIAPQASVEAVKVGEYQSSEQAEDSVAVMQSYQSEGRQAATLYVRNIPVLSFLGTEGGSSEASSASLNAGVKMASFAASSATQVAVLQPRSATASSAPVENSNDPAIRATAIAAQINQLHRNSIDASSIRAVWDEPKQRYLIKVGEDTLTAIDPATILADTTHNAEQDALQVTNRLRRLLGNAEPLTEVEGAPRPVSQVSLGSLQLTVSGYASWYGPGFNGNMSASGEVFNENALTAAHPNLPFGTQVRVTNLDNGLSVLVRINDRGPYAGDRLIDLSAGAAQVIGLINSGVAPVKLDVLGTASR
ncbi:MAG: septal ring lytic transglycosylase RlpA family protein [Leptolyngbyaceae cyanobacterium CSU_1_4]|nr:septal ring lytic transglycosylase RlpA family protein [Leptolyngbyaceae cyanobacterium CSU_1_4]